MRGHPSRQGERRPVSRLMSTGSFTRSFANLCAFRAPQRHWGGELQRFVDAPLPERVGTEQPQGVHPTSRTDPTREIAVLSTPALNVIAPHVMLGGRASDVDGVLISLPPTRGASPLHQHRL